MLLGHFHFNLGQLLLNKVIRRREALNLQRPEDIKMASFSLSFVEVIVGCEVAESGSSSAYMVSERNNGSSKNYMFALKEVFSWEFSRVVDTLPHGIYPIPNNTLQMFGLKSLRDK
ncbi:hypothetical protein Lser_V15G08793 [Lactuca serriola]